MISKGSEEEGGGMNQCSILYNFINFSHKTLEEYGKNKDAKT
jgi:hypothetical protein